jgi:hypothetical protein
LPVASWTTDRHLAGRTLSRRQCALSAARWEPLQRHPAADNVTGGAPPLPTRADADNVTAGAPLCRRATLRTTSPPTRAAADNVTAIADSTWKLTAPKAFGPWRASPGVLFATAPNASASSSTPTPAGSKTGCAAWAATRFCSSTRLHTRVGSEPEAWR